MQGFGGLSHPGNYAASAIAVVIRGEVGLDWWGVSVVEVGWNGAR